MFARGLRQRQRLSQAAGFVQFDIDHLIALRQPRQIGTGVATLIGADRQRMDKVLQRSVVTGRQRLLQHRHAEIGQQLAARRQPFRLPGLIGVDDQRRLRYRGADRYQSFADIVIVEFDLQQRGALLLQFTRGEGHRFRRADADGLRHTDMRRGRHTAALPQALPVQATLQIPQRRIQRVAGGARRHLHQQPLLHQRQARFYIINAAKLARECRLGARINTVMQMAFFHLTQILPSDVALQQLQDAIARSYSNKGQEIVERNWQALGATRGALIEIPLQPVDDSSPMRPPVVSDAAPDFVKTVTAAMLAGLGDALPVSAFPPDGTWPVGTTQWEKRNIAEEIPVWQPDLCTQCNHCVAACPHSAIRAKVVQPSEMEHAPASLQSLDVKSRDMRGQKYVLQVAPEDCTGCNLCVEVCPAKDRQNPEIKAINMASRLDNLTAEKDNYDFFLQLPEIDPAQLERIDIRTSQLITPLFEYSGACSGCGETPYIKLLTQLYGDRLLIANATGCSSIYGGNLPTTPYTTNAEGRGPAWANSLFEDNAEFGLGFRLTVDQHRARVLRLLNSLAPQLPEQLVNALQMEDVAPEPRRKQIAELRTLLASIEGEDARQLAADADYLVDKSIWLIGGDGWAYDIGFGGLDHVLSLTENVNVLVLDTQCYSNTGGQQSKATPLGAVTKFGEHGKRKARKDLGVSMMMYGHVYVAQISLGAQLNQTVKAIQEAEAYPGPSLIIAYSPCEEHGYDLALSHDQMKQLTATGFWPLYRFDPRRSAEGKAALALDSRPPNSNLSETLLKEQRFRRLNAQQPEVASALYQAAEKELKEKYDFLSLLAGKAEKSAAE